MTYPQDSGLTPADRAKLDAIPKDHFALRSDQTYTISTDPDNATILGGMVEDHPMTGWQNESAVDVGAIRNISGGVITNAEGIVSFHIRSSNASARVVSFYSETSIDEGVTWTKNDNSARTQSIASTSDQFNTKSSEVFNVPDQALVRFRVFASGIGVTIEPVSIVANGDTVAGPSVRWRLTQD